MLKEVLRLKKYFMAFKQVRIIQITHTLIWILVKYWNIGMSSINVKYFRYLRE